LRERTSPIPADARSGRARVPLMPLPPSLSPADRQKALEKAAAARRQRAELKDKLKMGTTTLAELIDMSAQDEVVAKMKVLNVLESLPGVGKVRARRVMDEVGISEARRLRGLGAQQRESLLKLFAPS
ncbi:MAG: integration host factor, actinobacterial type, partial [Pseudonocardiaceae bacterium]